MDKEYAGLNLGGKIYKEIIKYAEKERLSYFFCSTFADSHSHVRWMELQGFKKWKLSSTRGTSYYSLRFIYDITQSEFKNFLHSVNFKISSIFCKATYKTDGNYKPLGYVFVCPVNKLKPLNHKIS